MYILGLKGIIAIYYHKKHVNRNDCMLLEMQGNSKSENHRLHEFVSVLLHFPTTAKQL